ncbi:uncharacterized protein [Clytia hemisphaerica]|uniref:uncharacterized protein n=1 Tax=Clytia hemisphaerica TaxID=252671 RepID=UPI0034D3E648
MHLRSGWFKMTEHYRLYTLESRLEHKNLIVIEIDRIIHEMLEPALNEPHAESQDIEKAFEELDRQYRSFVAVHEECQGLFRPDEEERRGEEDRLAHSIDERICQLKTNFHQTKAEMKRTESQVQKDEEKSTHRSSESKSGSSKSSRSSKKGSASSNGSVKEKAILERARIAELKLKAKFLKETKNVDQVKMDAELKANRLREESEMKAKQLIRDAEIQGLQLENEYQIAMAEAKLLVLSENGSFGRKSIVLDDKVEGDYVAEYVASLEDQNSDKRQSVAMTNLQQSVSSYPDQIAFSESANVPCTTGHPYFVSNTVSQTHLLDTPIPINTQTNLLVPLSEVLPLVGAHSTPTCTISAIVNSTVSYAQSIPEQSETTSVPYSGQNAEVVPGNVLQHVSLNSFTSTSGHTTRYF